MLREDNEVVLASAVAEIEGALIASMPELWETVFGSRQELPALWEKCAWHRCLDRFWCCWHFLMMIELSWNTAETEICSG